MARHIPGISYILADALSRPDKFISKEWTFYPSLLRQIQATWELPQIDLFRHLSQQPTASIRQTVTGPADLCGRCSFPGLDRHDRLRFPPITFFLKSSSCVGRPA